MKRYIKSTSVDAKSALSPFDPIRKLLGEKEWYTIEEYLLNGDKKYSLKDILYDEDAWDAYADWKMENYHQKPALAASTRIQARKYLTASTCIKGSDAYPKSKVVYDQDGIVVKTTGRNYDFIATIENNTDEEYCVEDLGICVPAHDWIGLLADDEGYYTLEYFESLGGVTASTCVKAAAEGDYNKLIKRIDQDGYTCFIIQSGDEPDYWYWCVDTVIVDRYKGTDREFINDYENSSEGSSCASFATPEEAEKDFLGE